MTPYLMTFAYDANGRAFNMTYRETGWPYKRQYYLFYDADGRLTQAKVVPDDSVATTYYRWSYFFLGEERIAAVREHIVLGSPFSTVKLWLINDEHGTPLDAIDATGMRQWQADFEGYGWRQLKSGDPVAMWVPFALPGQLWMDETRAAAFTPSCFSSSSTCPPMVARPALAQHGYRDYDAYSGTFLEVDPIGAALSSVAMHPYDYAKDNPIRTTDPDGLFSTVGCANQEVMRLAFGIGYATTAIRKCRLCQDINKALWISTMNNTRYVCSNPTEHGLNYNAARADLLQGIIDVIGGDFSDPITYINRLFLAEWTPLCELGNLLAHEALHHHFYFDGPEPFENTWSGSAGWQADRCVYC